MKVWKLLVLILVIVLAGGAVVSFIGRDDDSGGRLVTDLKKHEECVYNIATGAVSAADDPDGKGYEYFACEECGEMRRIVANHESGHYFRTLASGKKICSCGASLEFGDVTVVTKHEFSSVEGDDLWINALTENVLKDGKFVVSLVDGQRAVLTEIGGVEKNPTLSALTSGTYNGIAYDCVSFSFDLYYTGDTSVIEGGNFFNWRSFWRDGEKYCDDISMSVKPTNDGRLIVEDKYPLEENVVYRFTAILNPTTNEIFFIMNGGKYVGVLLYSGKAAYKVTDFWAAYFGRNKFYCADTSQFGLYVDNICAGYLDEVVDQKMVNVDTQCDHYFVAKGVIDSDHPASEAWKKYTCEDCGCWYYGH